MPENDESEGFLMRWSRRKAATEPKPEPSVAPATAPDVVPEAAAPEAHGGTISEPQPPQNLDAEPIPPDDADGEEQSDTPHELAEVDIDALNYESDFKRFLGDGVPEELKRRALRKLWRSNPILANVDGLNDYDDDFTDAALAVDVLKTVYQVGKGYFDDDDDEDDLDDDLNDGVEVAEAETESATAPVPAPDEVPAEPTEIADLEGDAEPDGDAELDDGTPPPRVA